MIQLHVSRSNCAQLCYTPYLLSYSRIHATIANVAYYGVSAQTHNIDPDVVASGEVAVAVSKALTWATYTGSYSFVTSVSTEFTDWEIVTARDLRLALAIDHLLNLLSDSVLRQSLSAVVLAVCSNDDQTDNSSTSGRNVSKSVHLDFLFSFRLRLLLRIRQCDV